jgi:Zn-dependent protease
MPTQTYGIAMISPDGQTMGKLIYIKQTHGQRVIENLVCALVSVLHDGRYLVTSRKTKGFAPSRKSISNKLSVKATTEQLWRSHQEKLRPLRATRLMISGREQLVSVCGEYELFFHNEYIRRGIYREVSEDEVKLVKRAQGIVEPEVAATVVQPQSVEVPALPTSGGTTSFATADPLPPASPPPLPGVPEATARVQVEIAKLMNPRESWKSNAWLLAITAVLFVFSFKGRNSWESLWVLVLVLLIHESRHYVAMRLFKYRNVRMFFLPFFGAAVSGSHYSVPGWRKAIVSLMGPVPGIILGSALIFKFAGTGDKTLLRIAVFFVAINAFNLLPLLPLDGGWFWNTLVFSRNRWIESMFQVLAAVGLIAMGTFFFRGSVVLAIVGVFMLIGARTTFKLASAAEELKTEGFTPERLAGDEIPFGFTQRAIEKLNEKIPKANLNARQMAQFVLKIYERMASHPPKLIESFLLILIYVGAVGLAASWAIIPLVLRFG